MIKIPNQFDSCPKKLKIDCSCDYCDLPFQRTIFNIERSHKHIKKDSCGKKECVQKKKKEVFNLKYGCDNPFQSQEIKQKIADSNLQKYGVVNPTQNEEIRKKQKSTCLEKYGVENPFQSQEIKDKIKRQNINLYGVENSFQRKEVQEKQKKTIQKNYKVSHYSKTDEYKEKIINTNLERYGVEQTFSSSEIQERIKQTNIEKYGSPFPNHKYGKTQDEIKEWLNSFGFNFSSDYEILENKEIDLLDKDKKVGIEYCGLYWHNDTSPEPRDRTYHIGKYKNCLKKDVQLLTIFEDEWKSRQDQCKSHIKSILGIYNNKVFARKCKVVEISKEEARRFFDSYHIQGSNSLGLVFFGLFFQDELCAVMSLGRHTRKTDISKKEITLDRLCFKDGFNVVGGASKLFCQCLEWAKIYGYKKVISFSDNRWSLGRVYEKMGFILDEEYGADYSYVEIKNPRKRLSKQSQKKSITNCPAELTEHAWAVQRGLARIYDCGKKRWTFNVG